MLKFISKLVGSKSDRDLKKLQPFVTEINTYSQQIAAMSNDELRAKTISFKAAISQATAELEEEKSTLYAKIAETENYDAREPFYEQIEALDVQVLEQIEIVLLRLHPEAFGIMRETSKRFAAGDVRAKATDLDKELAKRHAHISIHGDEVIYANTWKAAGADMEHGSL